MTSAPPRSSDCTTDILVALVETLEAHGLPADTYELYDAVDVEALGRLFASSADDIEAQFTVEGLRVAVTRDGVEVLADERDGTPAG